MPANTVEQNQYPSKVNPLFNSHQVSDLRPEAPVRGEALLQKLEYIFLYTNRVLSKVFPQSLNPFTQLGAVANTNFLISAITGILLLFWYSPSLSGAYTSLENVKDSPYLGELMRSLHRYSSDVCMLFVLLHGFQTLFARKFGRSHWLAWISGIVLIGLLWFDGWTGYWLVWDERATLIAMGSAKIIDVLPIFGDQFVRSFITDDTLNSLLFFVVFFIHMLIPLAMGIFLWVHIMRLNRSVFFTNKKLSAVLSFALVLMSLVYPATSAGPAKMQQVSQQLTVDWFYLLPLFITDRLTGGLIWLLFLFASILLLGFPWWFAKKRKTASSVIDSRCNACQQCFIDCPFNAITMQPTTGRYPLVANIEADICTACGVCAGSCDSAAILSPQLPVKETSTWLNNTLSHAGEDKPFIAFLCSNSAAGGLNIGKDGSCSKMPGYKIISVPCAGWVHMRMVERAIRKGAPGVLITGCKSDPICRDGNLITDDRISGVRHPVLRSEKVADHQVKYLKYDRSNENAFLKEAADFRKDIFSESGESDKKPILRIAVAAILIIALGLITIGFSNLKYGQSKPTQAELILSFKHAGQIIEEELPATNEQELLPHMRGAASLSRVRVPVRMLVEIDDETVINSTYEPGGLFNDGSSIAIEKIHLSEGTHHISVKIGDTQDLSSWVYSSEQNIEFEKTKRRVVLFDKFSGFTWY